MFILSPAFGKKKKILIPPLLYSLCFLYTARIITCWVGTNSFPTIKKLRPVQTAGFSCAEHNRHSSQSAISNLLFLVPAAQRKIHVNTHSCVNQNTPVWFYLEGKIFPPVSVCWSFFLPCFSVSCRWGKRVCVCVRVCHTVHRVCLYSS